MGGLLSSESLSKPNKFAYSFIWVCRGFEYCKAKDWWEHGDDFQASWCSVANLMSFASMNSCLFWACPGPICTCSFHPHVFVSHIYLFHLATSRISWTIIFCVALAICWKPPISCVTRSDPLISFGTCFCAPFVFAFIPHPIVLISPSLITQSVECADPSCCLWLSKGSRRKILDVLGY